MPTLSRGSRVRRTGHPRVVIVLATLIMLVLLAGAGTARLLASDPDVPTEAPDDASGTTCTGTQGGNLSQCRAARLATGEVVRYAVLPPSVPTQESALIDLGGPGVALFGAHWPAGLPEALPEGLGDQNLIMLEEPWVTGDYDSGCRGSVREYFLDKRRSVSNTGALVWRACALAQRQWGWEPTRYRAALAAVADAESLTIDTLVGASFAGRRVAYLADAVPSTVVLVDPAPAGRFDGARYVAERRDAALRHLANHGCQCADLDEVAGTVRAAQRALDGQPVDVPGRSLPVTGADVGPAVVALGYQPEESIKLAWQALRDPQQGADLIGSLADRAWMRFGVADVSPAWLAYLDEVCPAFDGWSGAASDSDGDPVGSFLHDYHAPCAHAEPAAASRDPSPIAAEVCIVTAADGVTPPSFLRSWQQSGSVRIIPTQSSTHGDLAAVARCVE